MKAELTAWVEDGQGFVCGLPLDHNIKHSFGLGISSVIGLHQKDGYWLVEYAKTDGAKEKRSLMAHLDAGIGWVIVIGPPIALTETFSEESARIDA